MALFATFHLRKEGVVILPDACSSDGGIAEGIGDTSGVLVSDREADQVVHIPQDRVDPLLRHLGYGLGCEPTADAHAYTRPTS